MKRKLILVIALIAFTAFCVSAITRNKEHLEFQKVEIQSKEAEIKQLQIDYESLGTKQKEILEKHNASQGEIDKLNKEKEDLIDRQKQLEEQLSVKLEQQRLAKIKSATPVASAAVGCNTGNQYKDFIYMKESGCNPSAVNSIGCRGIGQACPGSKLPCGADFACQDAWFSNYAIQRYGSWEAAHSFWLKNHWW